MVVTVRQIKELKRGALASPVYADVGFVTFGSLLSATKAQQVRAARGAA